MLTTSSCSSDYHVSHTLTVYSSPDISLIYLLITLFFQSLPQRICLRISYSQSPAGYRNNAGGQDCESPHTLHTPPVHVTLQRVSRPSITSPLPCGNVEANADAVHRPKSTHPTLSLIRSSMSFGTKATSAPLPPGPMEEEESM